MMPLTERRPAARPIRRYPLETDRLIDLDNGETVAYFSRGHHDPSAFVAAAKNDWDAEIERESVRHDWHRWEIWQHDGEWHHCLHPAPQGKRGVFPVTIISFD